MDRTQQITELFEGALHDLLKDTGKSVNDLMLGEFSDMVSNLAAQVGYKVYEEIEEERANKARRLEEEEEKDRAQTHDALIDILNTSIDLDSFDYKTAAAACTLAYMGDHSVRFKRVESDKVFAHFQEALKRIDTKVTTSLARVAQQDKEEEKTSKPDRNEKKERATAPHPDRSKTIKLNYSSSDRDTIEKFFKELGL